MRRPESQSIPNLFDAPLLERLSGEDEPRPPRPRRPAPGGWRLPRRPAGPASPRARRLPSPSSPAGIRRTARTGPTGRCTVSQARGLRAAALACASLAIATISTQEREMARPFFVHRGREGRHGHP